MASTRKRVKIKGHYMQVRQRSTKKGKKGTLLGKWNSGKRGKKRTYRCKPKTNSIFRKLCKHKKAGSYCLSAGGQKSRCPRLCISYE